jgi:hypothetical protein
MMVFPLLLPLLLLAAQGPGRKRWNALPGERRFSGNGKQLFRWAEGGGEGREAKLLAWPLANGWTAGGGDLAAATHRGSAPSRSGQAPQATEALKGLGGASKAAGGFSGPGPLLLRSPVQHAGAAR